MIDITGAIRDSDFVEKVVNIKDNAGYYAKAEADYLAEVVKTSAAKAAWVAAAFLVSITLILNILFTISLAVVVALPQYYDFDPTWTLAVYVGFLVLVLGAGAFLVWLNYKTITDIFTRYLKHWSDE